MFSFAERQTSPGGGQVTFHPIAPRSAAQVDAVVRRADDLGCLPTQVI